MKGIQLTYQLTLEKGRISKSQEDEASYELIKVEVKLDINVNYYEFLTCMKSYQLLFSLLVNKKTRNRNRVVKSEIQSQLHQIAVDVMNYCT